MTPRENCEIRSIVKSNLISIFSLECCDIVTRDKNTNGAMPEDTDNDKNNNTT